MTVCQMCKHYRTSTESCGTLGVPKQIIENGYSAKLCGCYMPLKTRLKASKCPLDKWDWIMAPDEVDQLRSVLHDVGDTVSGSQIVELTNMWSKLSGVNRTMTTCRSCVREMIQDLRNMLAEIDKQEHKVKVKTATRRVKKTSAASR